MDRHTAHKALIAPVRAAMHDFDAANVKAALSAVCATEVVAHLSAPFGDSVGAKAFYDTAYHDLWQSWPDLERRDYIVIAGQDEHTHDWVGCAGYYIGTFLAPWLDIPPTGHLATLRFHEFFRIEDGKVAEIQAIWDIPEVMMQANAWPLAPSLGRNGLVLGPANQDGIVAGPYDETNSVASCKLIRSMLEHLIKHPSEGGPEIMQLERFWHPRMNWYGPASIGTTRGYAGFRHWHQIPFLNAMPDRGRYDNDLTFHFFGDGAYAAVTGWPNMRQSVSGDGWMGIAPSGSTISLRSLDFWRVERGLIRENWVLIDLIDVYAQLGVDVFARLREFNKARNMGPITIPNGLCS